jgi:hypothetical protein
VVLRTLKAERSGKLLDPIIWDEALIEYTASSATSHLQNVSAGIWNSWGKFCVHSRPFTVSISHLG